MEDWVLQQAAAAVGTIVLGVFSGLYSGLVVSRASRFNTCIREAERPLKGVEGMQEGRLVFISDVKADLTAMTLAADDLAADGHVDACIAVRGAKAKAERAIEDGRQGRSSWEGLEEALTEVRREIRKQRPKRWAIYSPWSTP